MHKIKEEFEFGLSALEHLKNTPIDIMGKWCLHGFLGVIYPILLILASKENIH